MCSDLISSNSNLKSCRLEVDTKYSERLCNLHNDQPLVAEKIEISKSILSDYCRYIANNDKILVAKVKKHCKI